jgi:hypothetical protein
LIAGGYSQQAEQSRTRQSKREASAKKRKISALGKEFSCVNTRKLRVSTRNRQFLEEIGPLASKIKSAPCKIRVSRTNFSLALLFLDASGIFPMKNEHRDQKVYFWRQFLLFRPPEVSFCDPDCHFSYEKWTTNTYFWIPSARLRVSSDDLFPGFSAEGTRDTNRAHSGPKVVFVGDSKKKKKKFK